MLAAIDAAAERLGNTRTVCKGSYVHPAVLDAYTEGWIRNPPKVSARLPRGLDAAEQATLRILLAAARPKAFTRGAPARKAA